MTAAYNNTNNPLDAETTLDVQQAGSRYTIGFVQGVRQAEPVDYSAPATGASVQASDQAAGLIIKPAGTIAALTVTMPANPLDGQTFFLTATQTVTTLTQSASAGQTLNGALTTIGAAVSTHGKWVYRAADTTWYLQ